MNDSLCSPLSEKSVARCRELVQILLCHGLMYRYPAALSEAQTSLCQSGFLSLLYNCMCDP